MNTPSIERFYQQPFEVKTFHADFADHNEIAGGESISVSPEPTVAITKLKGTGSLSAGAPSLAGALVSSLFTGNPVVGDLYKVVWVATTSAGHKLQITGELAIVEAT